MSSQRYTQRPTKTNLITYKHDTSSNSDVTKRTYKGLQTLTSMQCVRQSSLSRAAAQHNTTGISDIAKVKALVKVPLCCGAPQGAGQAGPGAWQ